MRLRTLLINNHHITGGKQNDVDLLQMGQYYYGKTPWTNEGSLMYAPILFALGFLTFFLAFIIEPSSPMMFVWKLGFRISSSSTRTRCFDDFLLWIVRTQLCLSLVKNFLVALFSSFLCQSSFILERIIIIFICCSMTKLFC